MEEIQLDTGMRQYRINEGGVLSMNPADPGLYVRFQEAIPRLDGLEKELSRENPTDFFREADERIREVLQGVVGAGRSRGRMHPPDFCVGDDYRLRETWLVVFGAPNAFTPILPVLNLLAITGTGHRVIENLFAALEPILLKGAQECVQQQVAEALSRRQEP